MSRIHTAFEKEKAFIGFVTGGDPSIEKSEEFILKMVEAGADLIEIGVPFSDPIAEGPVIQAANLRALAAGTTTDRLFELIASLRKKTQVPIVFLTYLNPVFKYGYQRFFERCRQCGVDGLIIPDLPYEEKDDVAEHAGAYDVDIISLIAPTSEDRIRRIAEDAKGFLYVVSSMGVTGMRSEIKTDLESMMKTVRQCSAVPAAVGFGINTPDQARQIAKLADGIIVGSAIVKLCQQYGEDAAEPIYEYIHSMKEAIKGK